MKYIQQKLIYFLFMVVLDRIYKSTVSGIKSKDVLVSALR